LPAFIVTKIQASMGVLRVPRSVELRGLDFDDNATYEAAIAEVQAAEKAEMKS